MIYRWQLKRPDLKADLCGGFVQILEEVAEMQHIQGQTALGRGLHTSELTGAVRIVTEPTQAR